MLSTMRVPLISVEQMKRIDAYAEKKFGLETGFMMETAGRSIASFVRNKFDVCGLRTIVLSGKGHNGGDGFVAARFLHNWGAKISVIAAEQPGEMAKLTKRHYGVLKSMHLPVMTPSDSKKFRDCISKSKVIVDALLGYSIQGDPHNNYAILINHALEAKKKGSRILAVDVPSGLDADTGKPHDPCIKADWTLALTLPKKGIVEKEAKKYVGELYVADIGVPKEVYRLLKIESPRLFEKKDIVKVK